MGIDDLKRAQCRRMPPPPNLFTVMLTPPHAGTIVGQANPCIPEDTVGGDDREHSVGIYFLHSR